MQCTKCGKHLNFKDLMMPKVKVVFQIYQIKKTVFRRPALPCTVCKVLQKRPPRYPFSPPVPLLSKPRVRARTRTRSRFKFELLETNGGCMKLHEVLQFHSKNANIRSSYYRLYCQKSNKPLIYIIKQLSIVFLSFGLSLCQFFGSPNSNHLILKSRGCS